MRERLQIRGAFEPTRLGEEPVRQAYEALVPPIRRSVRRTGSAVAPAIEDRVEVSPSRQEVS